MSSRRIRNAPSISRCWMPSSVRDELVELAREWAPLEVGGVLAGYWHENVAVITDWVGPGDGAEHERSHFAPDYEFHVHEIARLYAASKGTTIYLGDWHSHPNGSPSLSPLDEHTLMVIAEAPEARCPRPLMLILAGGRRHWSIQAFALEQNWRQTQRQVVGVELCVYGSGE